MNINDKILYTVIISILGIIQATLALIINKKNKFTPAYSGFNFGMILYYIIFPIYLLINLDNFIAYENSCIGYFCSNSINKFVIDIPSKNYFLYTFSILLFTLIFNFTYYISRNMKTEKKKISHINTIKAIKTIMYGCLILGGISLMLFFSKFGGVKQALKYAEYMRSFANDANDLIGGYEILIIPARLVTVVPFLLVYLSENDKSRKYNIEHIISIILTVCFYLYNAGRMPIICFLLCYIYMYIKGKFKNAWKIIILCGIFSLPLLDILDYLFVYLSTGSTQKLEINYIKYSMQFLYPFKNALNMSNIAAEYGYRFMKDYIITFLDLLPGITYEPSYVNTSLYMSGPNWKVLGGTPNDLLTFSYLQLNLLGTVIISIVMAIYCNIMDKKLSTLKESKTKKLFSAVISVYLFALIANFDFVALIRSNVILVIISIAISIIGRSNSNENSIRNINTD